MISMNCKLFLNTVVKILWKARQSLFRSFNFPIKEHIGKKKLIRKDMYKKLRRISSSSYYNIVHFSFFNHFLAMLSVWCRNICQICQWKMWSQAIRFFCEWYARIIITFKGKHSTKYKSISTFNFHLRQK